MRVWITVVGMSPFAVVNPLWAACRQDNFVPERIYLLVNEKVKKKGNVDRVREILDTLISEFGIRAEIKEVEAEETDFKRFAETIGGILKEEKQAGSEVAVDMTPGRKFMSAFAMYLGIGESVADKADRVYYLHLIDTSYMDKPYIEIPLPKQELFEMKSYLLGSRR